MPEVCTGSVGKESSEKRVAREEEGGESLDQIDLDFHVVFGAQGAV